jgi:hypothetical protein
VKGWVRIEERSHRWTRSGYVLGSEALAVMEVLLGRGSYSRPRIPAPLLGMVDADIPSLNAK